MSVPVSGYVKTRITVAADDGTTMQNVLHGNYAGLTSGLAIDLVENAAAWALDCLDAWYEIMSQYCTFMGVEVYLWNAVTSLFDPIGGDTPAHTFTGIGDSLPNQIAGMVTLRTPNPRVNGRLYLPAPIETENTPDGRPGTVALARLAGVASELLTLKNMPDCQISGSVYSPTLGTFNDVNGYQVSPYWATQRRRRPGVGI